MAAARPESCSSGSPGGPGRGEARRRHKDTAPLPGQGEPSRERLKRGQEGVEGCGGGRTAAARAGRSESREAKTRAREGRRLRRGQDRGPPQGDRTLLPAFRPPSCSATAGAALAATARRRRRQSCRCGPSERCMRWGVSQVPATGCGGGVGLAPCSTSTRWKRAHVGLCMRHKSQWPVKAASKLLARPQ